MPNPKKYLIANWKMTVTSRQGIAFMEKLYQYPIHQENTRMIIAPSFVSIKIIHDWIQKNQLSVELCAQNCASKDTGALTGEVSVEMLKEIGCHYVIIGHSERRSLFHEKEPELSMKVNLAFQGGLIPILCIGETLEEYKRGETTKILTNQLSPYKSNIPFIIAYEPVWSIGTGVTPTREALEKAIDTIAMLFPDKPLLYGGSVNQNNIQTLSEHKQLSGFLVGGASSKPETFYPLYQLMNQAV